MSSTLHASPAPQVIRKMRGEPFPDASGHLKLWCQFFNVLGDSTIKWYRDEEEILEVKRRLVFTFTHFMVITTLPICKITCSICFRY